MKPAVLLLVVTAMADQVGTSIQKEVVSVEARPQSADGASVLAGARFNAAHRR